MNVALSPGHNYITRFRSCSPIATGNHLDRTERISNLFRRLAPLRFWSAFRHFGIHFAESFRMSKSSWMMDPARLHEMPSYSAIDLAEIRRSSKISSWIWSIISGVVIVLGCPGQGASQVEKSPRLNWATQFLTVAYYDACSPNVFVRMAWLSFRALPCGIGGWGGVRENLMTVRVSMLLKSRALPDMLPFSLCNKKRLAIRHINRSLFPTTLWHREVGRAKDLSAPPRILLWYNVHAEFNGKSSFVKLNWMQLLLCSRQPAKKKVKLTTWESKNYKHKKQEEPDQVSCHPAQGHLQWS